MVMLATAFVFALKLPLFKNYFALIPALIIPAVFFSVIDGFFTRWSLCGLNSQYILGFYWLGLPLEQIAFYFSMPLASLVIYEAVAKLLPKDVMRLFTKAITVFLLLLTIVLFFVFRKQLYTSVTMLLCAFLLSYRAWVAQPKSLSRFYLSYLFVLIPVLMIYGILTSIGALWYDPKQIIGLKLAAIPVENMLYFFALFLMNVGIYDGFKHRKKQVLLEDNLS